MIIEPFGFPYEDRLATMIKLMALRCTQTNPKRDAVLLFDGAEGEGKTTFSVATGYLVKNLTGRNFNHLNIFFDIEKMIEFLQNTDNQIAIWDEPALQSLSRDSATKMVRNLERLLLMARNKRHFIMINIAYFNKFSDYIVWQRPLGMIHVYSRDGVISGRFVYIKKKKLEYLMRDWRSKKVRNYRKYSCKGIRGSFPDILNPDYKHNVLSDFNFNYYEEEKNKAIKSIGVDSKKEDKKEVRELKYKLGLLKFPIKTKQEFAEKLGITKSNLNNWVNRGTPP